MRERSEWRLTATGVVQVGLAVAYGAVVGSWLPVVVPTPTFAMAPVVVTLPAPRAAEAPPEAAGPALPVSWNAVERPGAAVSATAATLIGAGGGWGADTLPGAPRVPVVPLGWISAPPPASTTLAGSRSVGAGSRARGGCPAIVAEGDPVPAECRPAPRRAPRICPKAGEPAPGSSVICIRAED